MPIIKNIIPILEYDTDKEAVIKPGHHNEYVFAKKAVMLFMDKQIDRVVSYGDCEIVGEFETVTKVFKVYKKRHKGKEIVFVQTPLGGAGAVQIMEQLIAGGAKEIVATGCCGSLIEDTEGEFFIPTSALRQEGTSYHYLPPKREVELNQRAIAAIEDVLRKAKVKYRKCKTWTTDGFYRETKDMVLYRKNEGYSIVEMECASLAACAKMREIIFGQILFSADSLFDVNNHDMRNWGRDTFAAALELAMDAVCEI